MTKHYIEDLDGKPIVFKEIPEACKIFPEFEPQPDGTIVINPDKAPGFMYIMEKTKRLVEENRPALEILDEAAKMYSERLLKEKYGHSGNS
jgi:hypothetical protein